MPQKTTAEYISDEICEAMEACNYQIQRFPQHFAKGKSFETLINELHRLPSQYEMEEGLNLFLLRDEGYTSSTNHISYHDVLTTMYDMMVKSMTDKLSRGGYRNRV